MEKAIIKAIEGGYDFDTEFIGEVRAYRKEGVGMRYFPYKSVLLDPLFWQALGKSLGWDKEYDYDHTREAWLGYWHEFIDYLASGKDIESFFNELIK